jgi:hypothetical protein
VARIEAGEINASMVSIARIEKGLDVSMEQLLWASVSSVTDPAAHASMRNWCALNGNRPAPRDKLVRKNAFRTVGS